MVFHRLALKREAFGWDPASELMESTVSEPMADAAPRVPGDLVDAAHALLTALSTDGHDEEELNHRKAVLQAAIVKAESCKP
jgi:hypothetical protein